MEILVEKAVDLLIKRGFAFVFLWFTSCWQIFSSDTMLGLDLNPEDKGFLLVLVTMLYIFVHHFVAYWHAKRRYYSPAFYSDETRQATIDARKYLTSGVAYDSEIYTADEKRLYVKDKAKISTEIASMLQTEEIGALFMLAVTKNTGQARNKTEYDRLCREFREKTDWVKRK